MNAVLIIDDKIFRTILTAYFQMAGWQVFQAHDEATGLARALECHPRFVVCDLVMPAGNGLGICRRLRAEPGLPGMKFIIYSSSKDEETREAAFAAGADVFVQKPVRMDDVMALMQYLKSQQSDRHAEDMKTPRIFFAKESQPPE